MCDPALIIPLHLRVKAVRWHCSSCSLFIYFIFFFICVSVHPNLEAFVQPLSVCSFCLTHHVCPYCCCMLQESISASSFTLLFCPSPFTVPRFVRLLNFRALFCSRRTSAAFGFVSIQPPKHHRERTGLSNNRKLFCAGV